MKITSTCIQCNKTVEWNASSNTCECGNNRIPNATDAFKSALVLNQCPVCGCPHIYRQKDFNRIIGVLLIAFGVILAYWTYGVSLIIVTLIDWFLIRKVKELGVCYRCQTQFRDCDTIKNLDTFNLSLFDYYKNLPK